MMQAAGHEVTGLDTDLFAGCDFGKPAGSIPTIKKDLRDLATTDLAGFDAVVHLGALSNDPLGNLNGDLTYDINHRASVKLAELAKAAGVKRFVFSSSCSTYGAAGDDFLDETAELNPVTAYAVSKVYVERDVALLADDSFTPTFMRNATAYGASPRLRLDVVLNDLVAAAYTTGKVLIKSDGTPWRPIVHIQDIIGAMICALDAPREAVHNETFNVGDTKENYRISELADIVKEIVPGCEIEYAPGGGPDKRCYRVSCDKIRRVMPAFHTKWTARQGAQELYDAYRAVGLTAADLAQTPFTRISQIQRLMKAGKLDSSLRWLPQPAGAAAYKDLVMATMTSSPTRNSVHAPAVCRFCGNGARRTFIDLGMSPLCESFPSATDIQHGEMYYPLHTYVCEKCFLVQLDEFETPEKIFTEYAYFSSFSDSWLKHCDHYCGQMTETLGLGAQSFVVEVASNDGYLLQYFTKRGVPVLGIEPAANVAKVASEKGIPTLVEFFGTRLAERLVAEGRSADLVLGNNVLAQVPDLNDFVEGLKILLKPHGVLTLEFPHLSKLIEHNEFDTIYHEHFSYFSLLTAARIMETHGMKVFNVEELPTHGGSLRVYACRAEDQTHTEQPAVQRVISEEYKAGISSLETYAAFAKQVRDTKLALLDVLLKAAREGKTVAGYGAPGKSATLLHYCGITRDLIEYTVDRNPYKHGRFLPGNHIPIFSTDKIAETKPDYVVILPWNLKNEIMEQLKYIREWGGQFIIPIPKAVIL